MQFKLFRRMAVRGRTYRSCFVYLLSLAMVSPLYSAWAPVKAWEETVNIPTYLIGPPDPNPQFYFGGNSDRKSVV